MRGRKVHTLCLLLPKWIHYHPASVLHLWLTLYVCVFSCKLLQMNPCESRGYWIGGRQKCLFKLNVSEQNSSHHGLFPPLQKSSRRWAELHCIGVGFLHIGSHYLKCWRYYVLINKVKNTLMLLRKVVLMIFHAFTCSNLVLTLHAFQNPKIPYSWQVNRTS